MKFLVYLFPLLFLSYQGYSQIDKDDLVILAYNTADKKMLEDQFQQYFPNARILQLNQRMRIDAISKAYPNSITTIPRWHRQMHSQCDINGEANTWNINYLTAIKKGNQQHTYCIPHLSNAQNDSFKIAQKIAQIYHNDSIPVLGFTDKILVEAHPKDTNVVKAVKALKKEFGERLVVIDENNSHEWFSQYLTHTVIFLSYEPTDEHQFMLIHEFVDPVYHSILRRDTIHSYLQNNRIN